MNPLFSATGATDYLSTYNLGHAQPNGHCKGLTYPKFTSHLLGVGSKPVDPPAEGVAVVQKRMKKNSKQLDNLSSKKP